ncbi:PH domain-containing protein [Streptomyces sp. NBC_00873]|uniref:PH domain-containing protein n=1 Tax=unclassified Streptomyces TaxID=2593676 RepID=UPI00386F78F9|nr:PH domain-containing protein [Streptomyces sp. NBC_00873]WTA45818.1 PH domain-containing protein [Streptomyces sp. NBC_00842]
MTSPTPPTEPTYADRTFRSPAGVAGGVLLLLLVGWLGVDALIRGDGRTPWLALAGLLTAVPLIVAFTLRPVVSVNKERIRIRNPFRTITMPWAAVADVRAGYSTELFTQDGAKYQLWAVPVSLRQRKKAARRQARQSLDDPYGRTSVHADVRDSRSRMATADQTMADLRELMERAQTGAGASAAAQHSASSESSESSASSVSVRWAYELIAPAVVGVVLLVVLLATG